MREAFSRLEEIQSDSIEYFEENGEEQDYNQDSSQLNNSVRDNISSPISNDSNPFEGKKLHS